MTLLPGQVFTAVGGMIFGTLAGTIYSLLGSYIPFAGTRAARASARDPRPSIEERYPSREAYVRAVEQAAANLVRERLLLEEDAREIVERAREAELY